MTFALLIILFKTSCNEIEKPPANEDPDYSAFSVTLPGVSNVNGILHFDKRTTLESVYEDLLRNQNTGLDSALHDTICKDGIHPYLDAFEAGLDFVSVRKTYEYINCDELASGVLPMNLSSSHIFDDVMATLISPEFKVVIDDTMFLWEAEDLIYYHSGDNAEALLDEVYQGKTGHEMGVTNHLNNRYKKGDCNPSFSKSQNFNLGTATITYDGSPVNPSRITWTVKVNGNSIQTVSANTKTFVIKGQPVGTSVEVCCTVKDDGGTPDDKDDDCEMTECEVISIGGCDVDFDVTSSNNGSFCFQDKSTTSGGSITAWQWEINGETFTTQNVCYTFPCNAQWDVTLTIQSASCPSGSSTITRVVDVNNNECCPFKGDGDGEVYHDPDKNGINQGMWFWEYDLGSDIIWDQRLKTKLSAFRRHNNGTKFRKMGIQGMYVDFEGDLYKRDAGVCNCKDIELISPSPSGSQPYAKTIVVKDKLSGIKFDRKEDWNRFNKQLPVTLKYGCQIWPIIDINPHSNGTLCN